MLQAGLQLVVLDKANAQKWILDARDGRLISKEEWRDPGEIWCTAGLNVLSVYENKSNTKVVR